MKQKKGNVSLKSFNEKKNNSTMRNLAVKSPAQGTPAKQNPKKTKKTPVKVVPPKEVEDEEEEESEEEDSGADVGISVAEEADGSDEDDENGIEESIDSNEDVEMDVGEHFKKSVVKKGANSGVNSKKAPKVNKQKGLRKAENQTINEEEKKLLYEEKKRKIDESKNRTVYIKNIKQTTTEKEVREHFSMCGDIESIRLFSLPQHSYGFISFKDESSVEAAMNLHNSIIDGTNIWVVKTYQTFKESPKDAHRTVLVKNKQNLSCLIPEKLNSIFSKCGEIENFTILCTKNVLAFITFKESKGAKKALKLNGTSEQGLDIEVEEYKTITPKNKTTVFIQNVKPGVTEEDIRELFASTGAIESVNVNNGFAFVKFEDVEGFCKSFTLNESVLRGNIIFLEPYSEKKQLLVRKNHQKTLNRKRPAQSQQSVYSKKMKTN